jgi:hypothetical protein
MKKLSALKHRFTEGFQRRQSLRLHMSLILLATVCTGFLANRIMLALGLKNVMVRYPLAVVFAYLTFFISVKLWLKYVAALPGVRRKAALNGFDLLPEVSGSGSSGGGGGGFRGGGGNFGGAGVSGSFGEVNAVLAGSGAEAASDGLDAAGGVAETAGSAAGEAVSSLDLDKGWLVVLALGAIAAVFLGVGIYLIYQAPFILSEAAFEFILASGLARGMQWLGSGDWMGSIFRATWIPLAVTLFLAFLAGFLMHHYFPGATRIAELFAISGK